VTLVMGSVGTRAYLALCFASGDTDRLFRIPIGASDFERQ